jgi:DNA-binding SARP family transcriptional activator/WD40 repeat protein
MEIRCLGPLSVDVDGEPVALGGTQQRHVLALLVSRIPDRISTDALLLDIWGDDLPATARKTVQGYVSALRKVLPDGTIESDTVGYTLAVDPASIDVVRFAQETQRAAGLAVGERTDVLAAALAMWKGEPYEEFDSDLLRPDKTRLIDLRLSAIASLAEARIAVGDEAAVAAELADLTSRYPLNERLWILRALALYRSARQMEALRAIDEARRILATEGGLEPSHELRTLEQRVLEQDPVLTGDRPLEATLTREAQPLKNPYRGLRAFDVGDASEFHGREALVRRLVETVTARGNRLTVVAGASGSGKSSVARAGLTPALTAEGLNVNVAFPDDAIEFLEIGDPATVVLIDQLEEVFGGMDPQHGTHVLDAISEAVERSGGPKVIATVRADVLDRLLEHPRISGHLERSTVFITPLRDDEVRAIVTAPAKSVGLDVQPELVATFVAHAEGRASSLPMIQYALTELFDRTGDGTLTLQGLEAAGGIGGTLAVRADEILSGLSTELQGVARQVFLRLVHVEADGTTFGRRAPMHEMEAIDVNLEAIDAFLRARLLTLDRAKDGGRTIGIAHEAILREWPALRHWVDEAADAIRRHQQLAEAASEWEAARRPESMLLTGGRLARFADRSDADLDLAPVAQEFLTTSIDRNDAQIRTRRRRRIAVMAAFGAAALVATVLAATALVLWNDARDSAAEAEASAAEAEASAQAARHNERLARSNEMSAAARVVTEEDPELGILLAAQAIIERPDEPTIEQRFALREAMNADRLANTIPIAGPGEIIGIDLAPGGGSLALLTTSGLRLVDTSTWTDRWSTPSGVSHQTIGSPTFSPDGRLVAVGSAPGAEALLTVYDAGTGEVATQVTLPEVDCGPTTWSRGWSGDGLLLAIGARSTCEDASSGFVRVLDTSSWDGVAELPGDSMPAFSEESGRLALFDFPVEDTTESLATVYESGTFVPIREVEGTTGDVSPDGNALAAAEEGSTSTHVFLIDGEAHQLDRLSELDYLPAVGATDIAWYVPSGDPEVTPPLPILIVGTRGQSTGIWTLASGALLWELPTGGVVGLEFDPAALVLYTAGIDGGLRVWDLSIGGLSATREHYPYWFEANGFTSNPASQVATAMHYHLLTGVSTYAQFDTTTGALTATEIDEVGRTMYQVATLPDGQAAFVTGEAAAEQQGPFVARPRSGERSTIHGCALHLSEWYEPEVSDQSCVDNGEPFRPADAPVTNVGGTEIGAIDGTTFLTWDARTLDLLETTDLGTGLADAPFDLVGAVVRAFDDGWVLVQGVDGGRYLVFNRATSAVIAHLDLDAAPFGTEVAADGSFLLLATNGGAVYRVDTASWQPRLIVEPSQLMRGVAISNDGEHVMLGGTDGLVHVHEIATGGLLDRIPEADVSDGFWIDEERIAVGTRVGAWAILDLNIIRVAEQALGQVTRGFTQEECKRYDLDPCPAVDQMLDALRR